MFLRTLFYMLRQILTIGFNMILHLVNLRFSSASVVPRDSINLWFTRPLFRVMVSGNGSAIWEFRAMDSLYLIWNKVHKNFISYAPPNRILILFYFDDFFLFLQAVLCLAKLFKDVVSNWLHISHINVFFLRFAK
jgi:hypothetical protein